MKKSMIFFAALAALFSCAKENPVVETPVEETFTVELFASAPAEDAETKTTLVDGVNGGTPVKFVHWSKGDAVKVLFFPNHTNSNTFNGSASEFQSDFETETSEIAYFRTESWSWGMGSDVVLNRLMKKGIAVYPSTAKATSNKTQDGSGSANETELSFTLPDAQKAINGNIETNLNFSYADVYLDSFKSTIESKNAYDIQFNNACAIIQLTMPAEFEKEVTSVTISSNNAVALTGKGNVDMNYYKDEIVSPFHVTPEVTATSHTVTLAKADETPLEAGATYFAVVWPGAHEGLTISFNAADGTVATKPTKAVTLTASKVKPYTFSSALKFEAAGPKEYDYVYADGSQGNDPANAVAVIFFNGNPRENDPALPEYCTHGLAIGLTNYNYAFHTSNLPTNSAVGSYGIGTTNQYGQVQSNGNVYGYTSMTNWLMNFSDLNLYKQLPTPISNTSGWYVQTNCEWDMIASCFEQINEKLAKCGAVDKLETNKDYTTALGYGYTQNRYNYVYYAKISPSYTLSMTRQNWGTSAITVRPIFAF